MCCLVHQHYRWRWTVMVLHLSHLQLHRSVAVAVAVVSPPRLPHLPTCAERASRPLLLQFRTAKPLGYDVHSSLLQIDAVPLQSPPLLAMLLIPLLHLNERLRIRKKRGARTFTFIFRQQQQIFRRFRNLTAKSDRKEPATDELPIYCCYFKSQHKETKKEESHKRKQPNVGS